MDGCLLAWTTSVQKYKVNIVAQRVAKAGVIQVGGMAVM